VTGFALKSVDSKATTVTDTTLEDIERRLDRASDLESEDRLAVLRTAREDLTALGNDPDVDEDRRKDLENQLDQRLRGLSDSDAYGGELGAAMNPTDEDAP